MKPQCDDILTDFERLRQERAEDPCRECGAWWPLADLEDDRCPRCRSGEWIKDKGSATITAEQK